MKSFTAQNAKFFYYDLGNITLQPFWWGHGWGQSHAAFLHLAQSLERHGHHNLLDFPGFGLSPKPNANWGTEDYADAIAAHLRSQNSPPIIWVGHSFGGRVGLQLAARHPDLIKALVLIAGAGLKRKRSFIQNIKIKTRVGFYKFLKKLIPLGLSQSWLQGKFGSRDYQNAGAMRDIFLKVIQEDLSPIASTVTCPTLLIYGQGDTETPPEFGERYARILKNAELHILDGQDHYTVLSSGRHRVAALMDQFIQGL